MKTVLKKLFDAKKIIASQKIQKEWKNTFSNYEYFTPSQISTIVQNVCEQLNLFTKFDLVRDELWVEWQLTVYDVESWENIVFISATAIPEIKATNIAQQMWWCMTYTERYLKMTAFGIVDNSLDFDTTENTKKQTEKKVETKTTKTSYELPRFNKEQLEELKNRADRVSSFDHSQKLIETIETKYRISKQMKIEIAELRASIEK